MGQIIVGEQHLSFENIKAGTWSVKNPYFHQSLLFCMDWLNGVETFFQETSGSTGLPKQIEISRDQMAKSASATYAFLEIKPGENLFCCLNTQMIGGKMMLVRALEWRHDLYLVEPKANPFEAVPVSFSWDFVAMVPLQLQACMDSELGKPALEKIKNLIIGGAPISKNLRNLASKLPGNVYQSFGMTETASHIALADIKQKGVLIYQALPGVDVSVTQDNRLIINAPMGTKRPLITSDRIELAGKNRFIWTGRADRTINSGGIKINLEELEKKIEYQMGCHFPMARYYLDGIPDNKLGEKLILLIESPADGERAGKLLEVLKISLQKFLVPKHVFFVPEFKETKSGKINRLINTKRFLE